MSSMVRRIQLKIEREKGLRRPRLKQMKKMGVRPSGKGYYELNEEGEEVFVDFKVG